MKRIFAFIIFGSLFFVPGVFAQQGGHLSVQYDISFGMGDLGDYISKASFRGISVQYRYAATENILVGVDAAWYVFYEKRDYDTYTVGTQSISGIQYRTQNEMPILVAVDYLIFTDKVVNPYIGFGIGTLYTERATDMGIWRIVQDPWHFAIKPEAGILAEISGNTSAKIAVKYYNGFKSGDLDSQGFMAVSLGFAFGF
ncbi:MAG: OmpW family protein [Bacteroidetes bacterium]|nr:OmpW family protein [Bacteroidota bacterium]